MESELTSLLKRKYGTTKSSPVVFTEKDTLYTCFRKLADNIYKNGTWTEEDEKRAVDTMIRNRNGFPLGEKEIHWTTSKGIQRNAEVIVEPLREVDRTFLGDRLDGKVGYMTLVNRTTSDDQKTTTKKTYVLLDPENKSGTKHGTFYYFAHREVNEFTYMALGNMNRAIGYDKLQRDILTEFDSNEETLGFERTHLESFLSKLSSAEYSGKKHADRFEKDLDGELTDEFLATLPRDESKIGGFMKEAPYVLKDGGFTRYLYPENLKEDRRKNQIITFIQNYIQNTYDILLQSEYEKDIDKQTRASAWQTKKHINKETLEMMNTTSLTNYFGYVEIDNEVDLTLFKQFEAEMERVHAILPKTGEKAPDLRLRKLGNHNALGLYVPSKHTIAVDFRDTGDEIGGVGIQSFVHEYGHSLDYGVDDGKLLSMSEEFKPIVTRYRENIRFKAAKTYVGKKSSYYGAPTEVFARAFEIYVSEAGFRSPLLKTNDIYETSVEYALFDKDMREELTTYFDQRFPALKAAIVSLNKEEEKVDIKAEVVEQQKKNKIEKSGSEKTLDRIKQLSIQNEGKELSIGEALENCELTLLGKEAAIEWQESEVKKYEEAANQTDTIKSMTNMAREELGDMLTQPNDTLYLFDGSEVCAYSNSTTQLLAAIVDRTVFQEMYEDSIDSFYQLVEKEEQLEKWAALPREAQNEILVIYAENPVNAYLAFEKYGLEDKHHVFSGLNNVVQQELVNRYAKELTEAIEAFKTERNEWLSQQVDERVMYIPEILWVTAEKHGLMENYPKPISLIENEAEKKQETPNESRTDSLNEESGKVTSEEPTNDNSRLGQARRKLSRLQSEYKDKIQEMYNHQSLTNGQPMNDKRNGRSWSNRQEQLETSVRRLAKEIEDQEERVSKLENQKEAKELGLNKQGGLLMTVENIPVIRAEIEKYQSGESMYSADTIKKYEKQLEKLEALQAQATEAQSRLSEHAASLIASEEITPWAKNPMVYFVKGLPKVALELTTEGEFIPSETYSQKTETDKQRVEELLKGVKQMEETNYSEIKEQKGTEPTNQQSGSFNEEQIASLLEEPSIPGEATATGEQQEEHVSKAMEEKLAEEQFFYDVKEIPSFVSFDEDTIQDWELLRVTYGLPDEVLKSLQQLHLSVNRMNNPENTWNELRGNFKLDDPSDLEAAQQKIDERLKIEELENASQKEAEARAMEENRKELESYEARQKIEVETIKTITQNVQKELETEQPDSLERAIALLETQHTLSRQNNQWPVAAAVKNQIQLLQFELSVRDGKSLKPVIDEISKLEVDIAEREKDLMHADSREQTEQIETDIQRLDERKEALIGVADKCISTYEVEETRDLKAAITNQVEPFNKAIVSSLSEGNSFPIHTVETKNQSIVREVTYVLEGFKQEVDETLKEIPQEQQATINKADIERLLAQHMKKVEALIGQYTNTIDTMKEPTKQEVTAATTKMKKSIKGVLNAFKTNLTDYIATKKERTVNRITETLDDIRISVKNSINYQILKVNDQLKRVSNKIEQNITLEVKGSEIAQNDSEASTAGLDETQENNQVETKSTTEAQKLPKNEEKNSNSMEKETEGSKSKTSSIENTDKSVVVTEESKLTINENNQLTKIENLSKELGLEVTEKDKEAIQSLTTKEKEELIQALESTIETNPKAASNEEIEVEVG
ncbi:LPD1 domain-containing protein [Enterococcus faecalis]|uniref:LPD1 domain-containing protein n=1 Tax=Enterococcus faecalis TaxID=1351 RepID=UPI000DEBE202|nr:LPD1 domain-containing protein [Enterococcus faecalis]RBR39535.1 hypothetical protein EA76_02798 [Enterococcus faecalis]